MGWNFSLLNQLLLFLAALIIVPLITVRLKSYFEPFFEGGANTLIIILAMLNIPEGVDATRFLLIVKPMILGCFLVSCFMTKWLYENYYKKKKDIQNNNNSNKY